MVYLPTLGEKWPHSLGNVCKYSLHGSYGKVKNQKNHNTHRVTLIHWIHQFGTCANIQFDGVLIIDYVYINTVMIDKNE